MNQSNFLSILRYVLTAIGAYLVGKNFLGTPLDNDTVQGIIGALVSLSSIIWGIVDKSATVEQVQSGLRSVVSFFGMMLVGANIIKDEILESTLGVISVIVPMIYSQVSRKKNNDVVKGDIPAEKLSGINPPSDPNNL